MRQIKARDTILILLCLVVTATSPIALSQEKVAWELVEPASTNPALENVVKFENVGQEQLADAGIKRRDPSDIIKVGETYYVWYTKILEGTEGYPGGWGGTVWYATSPDGYTWSEQGQALEPASNLDAWDSHGVYTPNIAVYDGKYLLAYTAQSGSVPNHPNRKASIGIAVSNNPDGPWNKLAHNPVIAPGGSLDDADSFTCDDTVFINGDEGLVLYYKGWPRMPDADGNAVRYRTPKSIPPKTRGHTFLLGAVSADPTRKSFVKFSEGPLHRAHEMVLWPETDGSTGSFAMGFGALLYYRAANGRDFSPVAAIEARQGAAGLYRADFGPDWNGSRPSWGLKMTRNGLQRFAINWPDMASEKSANETEKIVNTYQQDLEFLQQHSDVIELKHPDGDARLSLVPAWQGRVMTSAASVDGSSFGWLNYDLIKAGVAPKTQRQGLDAHIYVFGGEERFWIGPEGGQFSGYFAPGSTFDFDNWFVPAFIDTDPWKMVSRDDARATFIHAEKVTNWSGHTWDMQVEREIILLTKPQLENSLALELSAAVEAVAYETHSTISNRGDSTWDETTGMPSVWILGMMKHGPETTVVIPFETQGQDLGIAVTDDYFGKVPAERLVVNEAGGVLYFSADGKHRSKIGISPQRSKSVAGSWDALNNVLTIVQYNKPPAGNTRYVNSLWAEQENPFEGDAVNSYNDGPVDGGQLGPFYEIETSSPALNLAPGERYTHLHRTIHLEGERGELENISDKVFGVSLAEIEAALR